MDYAWGANGLDAIITQVWGEDAPYPVLHDPIPRLVHQAVLSPGTDTVQQETMYHESWLCLPWGLVLTVTSVTLVRQE